jgi:hypothetical protein
MTDKTKPPAGAPGKPAIILPAKAKKAFDPASLKTGKGPGQKGPVPGKRMSLPGKARGR